MWFRSAVSGDIGVGLSEAVWGSLCAWSVNKKISNLMVYALISTSIKVVV